MLERRTAVALLRASGFLATAYGGARMSSSTADVKNWMHMFRWIVKLIRDEYGIDEKALVRTAVLESDLGLSIDQVERILEFVSDSFEVRFPDGTLDEVLRLEELCLVASWLKGFYKRPAFIGDEYEASCRAINPGASTEV